MVVKNTIFKYYLVLTESMVDPLLSLGLGAGAAVSLWLANSIHIRYNSYKNDSVKLRTGEGDFEEIIKNPRKKYGLILLYKPRFSFFKKGVKNTGKLVYDALVSRGYDKDNLFVLEGKKKPTNRFDCHMLPYDKAHIGKVLEHLAKEIKEDDVFFMYVLTHGYKTHPIPLMYGGQSTLITFDDEFWIKEKELEERLSDIHPNYSVTFFNSCFGGGFAKRLGKGRNIGISVSRADKITFWYVGYENEEKYGNYVSNFTLGFFSALKGEFPNGLQIDIPQDLETIFDASAKFERKYRDRNWKDTIWGKNDFIYRKILLFGTNTPNMFYDKINPKEVIL